MKRLTRDQRIGWIILTGIIIFTFIFSYLQQTRMEVFPPFAAASTQGDGARVLVQWLGEIGYQVSSDELDEFIIPDGVDMVLMLQPTVDVTLVEWDELDRWIADGGTLVVVGDSPVTATALSHYDFAIDRAFEDQLVLNWQTPLTVSPPVENVLTLETNAFLITDRSDFVTHLAADDQPVLVSFEQGAGRVVLGTVSSPFSNRGLRGVQHAPQIVLNIVSLVGKDASIWFNDWHHGIRGEDASSSYWAGPWDWLRFTSLGRSVLLIVVVIFITIALGGQRFGRPVPVYQDIRRRAPLEYVTAIANLNRRAGHRADVQMQFHHHLKRTVGKRYRLNPGMPDADFVDALSDFDSTIDTAELNQLLGRLQNRQLSELEFVRTIRAANELIEAAT